MKQRRRTEKKMSPLPCFLENNLTLCAPTENATTDDPLRETFLRPLLSNRETFFPSPQQLEHEERYFIQIERSNS